MKRAINLSKTTIISVLALAAIFAVWAWQSISSALKKGVADGASIRVAEKNSCAPAKEGSDTPHFSGCNSIL